VKLHSIKFFQAVEVGDSKSTKNSTTHVNVTMKIGEHAVLLEIHPNGYLVKCGDDIKLVGFNNVCYAKFVEEQKAPAKK
jgi:hypothetical protein